MTLEEIQLLLCDSLPAVAGRHMDLHDMPARERGGEQQMSSVADLITLTSERHDQLLAYRGFFKYLEWKPPQCCPIALCCLDDLPHVWNHVLALQKQLYCKLLCSHAVPPPPLSGDEVDCIELVTHVFVRRARPPQ
ncbi:hypothetical protein D9M72_526900 [compost metagenome]